MQHTQNNNLKLLLKKEIPEKYLFFFRFLHSYCYCKLKKAMKRIFSITFVLFLAQLVIGQTDSSFKSILNDSILNRVYSYLPKGWTVIESTNQIAFLRLDSVYSLEEYRFGSSNIGETKAERNERIKNEGKKGVSKFVLRYEDKWSYSKLLSSKNNNTYYNQKLQKLPEKYKISNLYNAELSTKQNPVYIGVTDKEKDAIKKFEKEREEISAKITTLPNYNTEKYSFFIISMEGCNDDNHYVLPEEASLQFFKLISLFTEFAGQ